MEFLKTGFSFIPIVGNFVDIYDGCAEGNALLVITAVGFLAIECVSLGSGAAVTKTAKAMNKCKKIKKTMKTVKDAKKAAHLTKELNKARKIIKSTGGLRKAVKTAKDTARVLKHYKDQVDQAHTLYNVYRGAKRTSNYV